MSIPTNIVEGSGQERRREFGRFLRYAANSATELEYHKVIAPDIRVISVSDLAALESRGCRSQKDAERSAEARFIVLIGVPPRDDRDAWPYASYLAPRTPRLALLAVGLTHYARAQPSSSRSWF